MRWRVPRSERDFASTADVLPGGDQILVMEGTDTHMADEMLEGKRSYFYTVFAQDEQGAWHLRVKTKLEQHEHLLWHHGEAGVVEGPSPSDVGALALASYPEGLRR